MRKKRSQDRVRFDYIYKILILRRKWKNKNQPVKRGEALSRAIITCAVSATWLDLLLLPSDLSMWRRNGT